MNEYELLKIQKKGLEHRTKAQEKDKRELEIKMLELKEERKLNKQKIKEMELAFMVKGGLEKQITELIGKRDRGIEALEDISKLSESIKDIELFISKKLAPLEYDSSIRKLSNETEAYSRILELIEMVDKWSENMKRNLKDNIIEVDSR